MRSLVQPGLIVDCIVSHDHHNTRSLVQSGLTGVIIGLGVLDFLTSAYYTAKNLRDRFIFKIVPMLNIDGVVNGR